MNQYFRNIFRQKASSKDIGSNHKIGEVVSGDEFEERDDENFYVNKRNNIQINQMISEIGQPNSPRMHPKLSTLTY